MREDKRRQAILANKQCEHGLVYYCEITERLFLVRLDGSSRPRLHHWRGIKTTFGHTTLGMTPLDE